MNQSSIPPGHWTLAGLRDTFPHIHWDEPIKMRRSDDPQREHYACRICIANTGMRGEFIPYLPTDPEVVREHIRTEHPA